jgi:hypothetical protein
VPRSQPVGLFIHWSSFVEFVLAVLDDYSEISRRLFLFQVITEILIVYGFAASLALIARRRRYIPANG